MLVVVVEGVEEDSETVPLIRASENRSLEALGWREPEGETVGADSSSTGHSEMYLDLPPVKGAGKLGR